MTNTEFEVKFSKNINPRQQKKVITIIRLNSFKIMSIFL